MVSKYLTATSTIENKTFTRAIAHDVRRKLPTVITAMRIEL